MGGGGYVLDVDWRNIKIVSPAQQKIYDIKVLFNFKEKIHHYV
jgi:hypothetical protein